MSYRIITIGREFGCFSTEIATQLSNILNIPFYDHGRIRLLLKNMDLKSRSYYGDTKVGPNRVRYSMVNAISPKTGYFVEVEDEQARMEFGIIRQLAERKSCIMIGRCANYLLRNRQDCYSVFIKGNLEKKLAYIGRYANGSSKEDIEDLIVRTETARSNYYHTYTGGQWGNPEEYDAVFDVSELSEDEVVTEILYRISDIELKA